MKKRILAFLLVFCMTVSLLPSTVFATNTESEKTKVNLVLVDGQSNAAGNCGQMLDATVTMPNKGEAYIWNGEAAVDLNDAVTAKVAANSEKSVGFHPALAKALYEATGIPTVIVHQGNSGESIYKWAAGNTAKAVAAVEACQKWLDENGFEVVNSGYIWLQGESDACPDFVADYCTYTTLDEYYDAYETMHNAFVSALGEGAVGGIVTVQTRLQLLSNVGRASEYIGVRAAQQALANQIENLVIVSDITDDWRKSTDSEMFSVAGGPIHYSQAGYNAIGLDAGANLAKVWAGNAAVTGFELVGYDGTTVYADGAAIDVSDNLIYEGTQNTREHGAAQIVVKPLPVYADCAGVTMTAEGDVITDNGYIADASSIKGDLELTVTATGSVQTFAADSGLTQTFTLSGGDTLTSTTPETPADFDYLWDFTDTSLVNGKVLTAVKGDNNLTYTKDITLTSDGMNNNANGRSYFLMDEEIVLAYNEPWTIEWQGSMTAASTVVSDTDGATLSQCGDFIYVSTSGSNNVMQFKSSGNSIKAELSGYANAVKESSDTIWYAIHDGQGNLTLACADGNGVVYQKKEFEGVIKKNYTYDAVLGYFNGTTTFNYYGTIQYLAIYNEAYELPTADISITGEQTVAVTAPATGIAPVTTVSGANYSGTIIWTPAVTEMFAGKTVYTAAVVLTANEGYDFAADATAAVAGATVSGVVVSEDGETLSFSAVFPETAEAAAIGTPTTDDFYWDFTSAEVSGKEVSSVSGNGWTENSVIYTDTSAVNQNATTGLSTAKGKFFQLQTPALLPKDSAWTIEWTGAMSNASIVFADNNNETGEVPTSATHMHLWYDGNGIMHLRGNTGSDLGYLTLDTKVYSGKTATWYVSHDGNGTLTLAACYNGAWLSATKANAVTADMTLDSLMGVYNAASPYCYQGSMKSFKVYHEALIVEPTAVTAAEVAITAPKTNAEPQTAITGENFSGTIAWSPAAATFASGTVYTATVTLTAADGYAFGADTVFTVPGVEVKNVSLSKNCGTATFQVEFPMTKVIDTTSDFYWDFTNPENQEGNTTVYSEKDDKWTENNLTYIDHSQKGNNLKLKETGFSNNGGGYFEMDKAVYLPLDEPWTIEWKGNTMWSSVLMANNDTTAVDEQGHKTSEYIYIYNNDKTNYPEANYITVANSGTAGNNQKAAGFGPIPTTARENPDSVWYLKNTNQGDLFLEYRSGDATEKVYINANTDIGRKNYTFDSLLGYFTESAPIYYASVIQYLKIYRDEVVNQSELTLTVPNSVPAETSLNTAMFTASINWDDMATMAVTETVNRVATVTLKAAPGYRFSELANFSIPGAAQTEVLSISEDGSTAEVMAMFQIEKAVPQDLYSWDFTDVSKVSGSKVAAVEGGNDLTFTGGNVTANASGLGDNAKGTYYLMDSAITLSKDEAWTIEWTGVMKKASLVFSNNGGATAPANSQHEHLWFDGTGIMHLRGASGSDLGSLTMDGKAFVEKKATWYVTHDGNGTLTFAVTDGNKTLMASKANAIKADVTVDSLMGVYTASNPFNYQGTMESMKIYREAAKIPVAKIGDTLYASLAEAVAAVETGAYPTTPASATTITLLTDVESGFDVGVETGSISTFKTQNIVLDLNGHTLTLGYPPVGSSSVLKTNGLRVLAFSKLEIKNGKVAVDNDAIRIALANYGTLTLTDVDVTADTGVVYTVNNRGDLTLAGATSVVNGTEAAITNQPYNYPDAQNINAKLNVASADVVVGDVQVELSDVEQGQTGAVNAGVPEINISAGTFGKIYDDGETAKTPVGNITGGTFSAAVPEDLCADGFIPENNGDGTYGVKVGEYVVEMTVNGVTTKYESINDAVAAAPVDSYANGKAGGEAEKAVIKLLKDTKGGFDVGVETGSLSTWKIQNIEIDLNGHTLTLGQPLVGSTGTKTSGIRVLAYSKLSIYNGTIAGDTALRGLQNYGAAVVEDVEFTDMDAAYDTIGNFGSVELKGETIVPNGSNSAILNSSYQYSDDSQVGVTLTIEEDTVTTGKIVVDLTEYTHSQTGDVNAANPEIIISAGQIESIESTGDDKELEGGVSGGTFSEVVPEDLCADGFVPVTEPDENGKYTVEVAPETRAVTRIENSAKYSFSSDGKTLSVKNDQACVVIVKNGESYTKLTATENADGGYDFDLTNVAASAEIIIAVKGDTTGDGIANATDARQIIVAANGGTALSDVGYLCADTTGDGTPNATDARQIIVAANGGTAINW